MNILVPMASGDSLFNNAEFPFPKPLVEIFDVPMIQYVVSNLMSIVSKQEQTFIFIVNESDCEKYHLDDVLALLTAGHDHHVIKLGAETKGAACTALMGVDYINNDSELLIANSDQLIASVALNSSLDSFRKQDADAGVVCFNSVHPRWSYARVNGDNVIELAEKHPISNHAIAGIYYFKNGKKFVHAAKQSICKDAQVNGSFYIAPTLNEMILDREKVSYYQIDNSDYQSFYSPQRVKDFCAQSDHVHLDRFITT